MTIQAKAIVRDSHTLEILSPLPFEEGTELVLQIEASVGESILARDDLFTCLEPLIGIGNSGLGDVSENKHRYLAEAYLAHCQTDTE